MATIYIDQELTCVGCGDTFTWSAHDQRFAAEKGYNPPRRCPPCRDAMKQQRQTTH